MESRTTNLILFSDHTWLACLSLEDAKKIVLEHKFKAPFNHHCYGIYLDEANNQFIIEKE